MNGRQPSTTALARLAQDRAGSFGATLSETADSITATLPDGKRWIYSQTQTLTINRHGRETISDVLRVIHAAMEIGTY